MTALAQFDGLTLRATGDQDRGQLAEWIAGDAYHAGQFEPEYFMGPEGCFAIEDSDGVVFYIRLAKVARVRVQFDPARAGRMRKARVANALARGMALLEAGLARAGTEEWVFDTEEPGLRNYARSSLGFRQQDSDLVRAIRKEASDV